jgi:hypothetical protein
MNALKPTIAQSTTKTALQILILFDAAQQAWRNIPRIEPKLNNSADLLALLKRLLTAEEVFMCNLKPTFTLPRMNPSVNYY